MKVYFLSVLVLLLAGCNDKTQMSTQQTSPTPQLPIAQQPMQQPAMPSTQITPVNTGQQYTNPLLAQHIQEINGALSSNPLQAVMEQSTRAFAAPIEQNLKESFGTELQTVTTDFNGQHVTFEYQVWQVRQPSVCSQVKYDIGKFSACTQAAKALFQQMCAELKQVQSPYHRAEQYQRMYCKAAKDFKPTIAQISHGQSVDGGEGQRLRKVCNDLTFKAMISEKDQDIKARDKACAAYKKATNLE